jgi:hypothetical protein
MKHSIQLSLHLTVPVENLVHSTEWHKAQQKPQTASLTRHKSCLVKTSDENSTCRLTDEDIVCGTVTIETVRTARQQITAVHDQVRDHTQSGANPISLLSMSLLAHARFNWTSFLRLSVMVNAEVYSERLIRNCRVKLKQTCPKLSWLSSCSLL